VRNAGKSFAHPLVVLVAAPFEENSLRIGVTATRTLGGAVERNRAKRLLREAMRPLLEKLPLGWDIILIARQPLLKASFQELCLATFGLLKRARLLQSNSDEPALLATRLPE
jgi:ribonuclease P protein component